MLKLSFDELQHFIFESEFNDEICINHKDKSFYFLLKYNKKFNKIICFSNGAIDPSKKKPPLYQRSTWKNEFKLSCLYIDDITLHGNGLKIGWGQGKEDSFALELVAEIIEVILKRLDYRHEATLFYGSSAGGFMSMYLGILIKGSKVIVNNPQTNVLNYLEKSVNQMLEIVYPGLTKQEVIDKYLDRLSITKAFEKYQYIPDLLYMQNRASLADMRDHVNPFITELSNLNLPLNNIEYYYYKHPKEGHSPLSKDRTIRLIHYHL